MNGNSMDRGLKSFIIWVGVFLVVVFLLLSIYSVPAGKVGVITRFGAINRVVNPGVGFKIPLVERNIKMSVQTQRMDFDTGAASSDIQKIDATISVNYRLIGEKAANVYQEIGRKYEEIVLEPAINQAFKTTTAQYTAEEIITMRDSISRDAMKLLQEDLNKFHITVQAFNIANVEFSPEYDASIEQKQVQSQKVEIARLKQKEAEINAETVIIEAQAQADSQDILSKTGALSPSYLQYLFLSRWNGSLPEVYMMAEGTPVFDVGNFLE